MCDKCGQNHLGERLLKDIDLVERNIGWQPLFPAIHATVREIARNNPYPQEVATVAGAFAGAMLKSLLLP